MNRFRRALAATLVALLAGQVSAAAPAAEGGIGVWTIADGRSAPWADRAVLPDPAYPGSEVRLEPARVVAPHPIACEGARYEWLFVPPEGAFEGHLPAPAAQAARKLGLPTDRVPTLRVTCTNAHFDLHRTADGDLLLGLDKVVWRLRPVEMGGAPSAVVQALLLRHFGGEMAFTAGSVRAKQTFLSTSLRARIAKYLAMPASPDQAPLINGDPFTSSQEYPDRFSLGTAQVTDATAMVPVRFADAAASRMLDYLLVREGERWVVDDVRDARQPSLKELLAAGAGDFSVLFARMRPVFASGTAAQVAELLHVPFLYGGRKLDRATATAIVPKLFTPAVRKCLATRKPLAEDGRQVVFCRPYAFYFGWDAEGYRLMEFGADGEGGP